MCQDVYYVIRTKKSLVTNKNRTNNLICVTVHISISSNLSLLDRPLHSHKPKNQDKSQPSSSSSRALHYLEYSLHLVQSSSPFFHFAHFGNS